MPSNVEWHFTNGQAGSRLKLARRLYRGAMLEALGQIRSSCMETTLFQAIRANERVPLVVAGSDDLPRLHLRGRILWQKAVVSAANPQGSGMFRTAVGFDHPHEDLKQITTPLIARLNANNDIALVAGVRRSGTDTGNDLASGRV